VTANITVMGHDCGYLALMSGLATGAERIYPPEQDITLDDLVVDVHNLSEGFRSGKRLGLVIRSENADPVYTTGFITSVFEKEGGELFDAGRPSSDISKRAGTLRRSTASRPLG
jgi:6-phosphofructokinase 1